MNIILIIKIETINRKLNNGVRICPKCVLPTTILQKILSFLEDGSTPHVLKGPPIQLQFV